MFACDSRRGRALEDVRAYHQALRLDKFFKDMVVLQRTWAQLIRILLAARGLPAGIQAVKSYQKDRHGRQGGDACLLELLPLPSPGASRWLYPHWSRLPFLSTRQAYQDQILPVRLRHLQSRIEEYRPRCVVFYGKTYWTHWQAIIGAPLDVVQPYGFDLCQKGAARFLIVQHPTARGARTDYFITAAKYLRSA